MHIDIFSYLLLESCPFSPTVLNWRKSFLRRKVIMLSFQNDYQEGAHEKILKRLMETNLEPQSGYGSDSYTESAKEKIRKVCECPQADVWFLTGGTQTNQNVIDAMLQPYEGVVAASTGHVSVHEAGAIEFTGHKVLTIPLRRRAGELLTGILGRHRSRTHGISGHGLYLPSNRVRNLIYPF